jgi:hypothetical protein
MAQPRGVMRVSHLDRRLHRDSDQVTAPGAVTSMIAAVSTDPTDRNKQNWSASVTHWRAAHVNWFTQWWCHKCYRHRHSAIGTDMREHVHPAEDGRH